jgi:N-methylhydantoinase A
MREGLKDERYNLRLPPPEPLVPRDRRLGVRERVKVNGAVLTPLDRSSLDHAVSALRTDGVEAVAVCDLHAYRNPAHEAETRRVIEGELPGDFVSLSSEVLPQI